VSNGRMTVTDVAERLGVTTKTITRWEKSGKITRAKRDWRGWRVYEKEDFRKLREFKDAIIIPAFILFLLIPGLAGAQQQEELKVIETPQTIEKQPSATPTPQSHRASITKSGFDPMKYTLRPDDIVEITVMRHPEFSGIYPVNLEGKLQYKFVGDIDVLGLTKQQLEQKIKEIVSVYVISPEVNVTVTEYKSKVIYVLGEVGQPGKYYMRSETIPVREAVVQAGLPTLAAAMRKCRIVTPDKNGRVKTKAVDLYALLYGGKLNLNYEMKPGDVLYVPSTIMAKVVRVINPVTSAVGIASSGPNDASAAKSAVTTLAK
jgi:polysaccharide export outer membrane protein